MTGSARKAEWGAPRPRWPQSWSFSTYGERSTTKSHKAILRKAFAFVCTMSLGGPRRTLSERVGV